MMKSVTLALAFAVAPAGCERAAPLDTKDSVTQPSEGVATVDELRLPPGARSVLRMMAEARTPSPRSPTSSASARGSGSGAESGSAAPAKPGRPAKQGSAKQGVAKQGSAREGSAREANARPGDGPQLSEAEMDGILELEHGKERWDYDSVRKSGGMTYGGSIYTAKRCDNKDGCEGTSSGWKPAGWWMPSADPVAAKPAPAKPARRKNARPGDGPHLGQAEMERIPDFENGKERWDYGSVRKRGAMTYGGDIYLAERCDEKDGCEGRSRGWKPAGWWMP